MRCSFPYNWNCFIQPHIIREKKIFQYSQLARAEFLYRVISRVLKNFALGCLGFFNPILSNREGSFSNRNITGKLSICLTLKKRRWPSFKRWKCHSVASAPGKSWYKVYTGPGYALKGPIHLYVLTVKGYIQFKKACTDGI